MSKKKILVVTELYPYPGNIYLGTFVTQQLNILKKSCNITVLTVYPSILRLMRKQPPYSRMEAGIRVVSLPYFPLWLYAFKALGVMVPQAAFLNKLIIRRQLHRIAKKLHAETAFDLVHGHEVYIGDEAGSIGKILGIPSVFTLHSFNYYHKKIFGKFVVNLAINNLRQCDRYLAVSSISAESYISEGLDRKKFTIIPNGITLPQHATPDQRILDFANGRKVLLSIGYLTKDKRFDVSIQTLNRLSPTETVLVIVGGGTEKQRLLRLAISLGCADRILWLGSVEPNKMTSVYQAADIIIHPSIIDSFSMVCLEAMSYSKVVICTTKIGILEFAKNGINIIAVPPDNVLAVVSWVKQLLRNQQEYQRFASQAHNFTTTMTWAHQIEKLLSIYDQLLASTVIPCLPFRQ